MNNNTIPLTEAMPGEYYIIRNIKKGETGMNRFRGYGFLPGSRIKLLFSNPSRSSYAYEIMGTTIALRYEDAKDISVRSLDETT